MRERWPEWTRDRSELWEPLRAFTRASILEELTALTRGLPEQCPSVDSEGARRTAQAGAPLGLMLTGYRVGHLVQWQAWLDLVWECEQDDGTRRALLGHGSNFFFAYAEMLEDMVTAEFTRERDQLLRGREQRRVHLVRELLDGREVDAGGLNYPLEGRIHLGLVVRGPGAANAVHELARRLGRAVLVVEIAGETWWAWIGGAHALDAAAEDVVSRFRPPAGVRIAVGAPHAGPAGFRRSYREASAAQRAALATNAPVTRYQDVALEVLAAGDEDAARAFVERELAGLEGSDARSHRLVETLTAYFEHDQNAAATAAALGVHEQTVANRLRAVEDRIGRPVGGAASSSRRRCGCSAIWTPRSSRAVVRADPPRPARRAPDRRAGRQPRRAAGGGRDRRGRARRPAARRSRRVSIGQREFEVRSVRSLDRRTHDAFT